MTFVETVLTVVLLGVVVVPVLAAIRGAVHASSISEQSAQVETVLINAVDNVHRAPTDGSDCSVEAEAKAALAGWDGEVTVFEEWRNGANWEDGARCGPNVLRRVTVTVTSPRGEISRSIQLVKT